ncbi:uncharacterized protein C2orf74 homolog [Fukomys damarensis]|uniref:uncharacterized protein C2orf74 homolog n=1 Tax=Fukomys damarensis TaxID=885580 RepID=UPI00053FEC8F|nr:uncharacterized protein C2orf74 homolog [Fukomys damarensis]XP_033620118.1 uncharacterized protein C2orf74 homolog [Fukomys damarensis]
MRMDESSKANPLSFESTAVPFFIILLICFVCIFFLLVFFLYKCFQDKKDEVTEKIPCIDANGGEDCSPANEEADETGDQEKVLMQIRGSNAPVRPGILVQRQNKVVTSLGNIEGMEAEKEDKMKDRQRPEDAGEVNQEGENLREALIPSITES